MPPGNRFESSLSGQCNAAKDDLFCKAVWFKHVPNCSSCESVFLNVDFFGVKVWTQYNLTFYIKDEKSFMDTMFVKIYKLKWVTNSRRLNAVYYVAHRIWESLLCGTCKPLLPCCTPLNKASPIRFKCGLVVSSSCCWSLEFAESSNRLLDDYAKPHTIKVRHLHLNLRFSGECARWSLTKKTWLVQVILLACTSCTEKLRTWFVCHRDAVTDGLGILYNFTGFLLGKI